jgi:hypothetical protein
MTGCKIIGTNRPGNKTAGAKIKIQAGSHKAIFATRDIEIVYFFLGGEIGGFVDERAGGNESCTLPTTGIMNQAVL